MLSVDAQIAALRATVEGGMAALSRRMDDQSDVLRDRHEENVARLERIEEEVKQTNGRVTRHDEQIRTLFRMRKSGDAGDATGISRRDVAVFLSGGGALIAAWKFVEWAAPLLMRSSQ